MGLPGSLRLLLPIVSLPCLLTVGACLCSAPQLPPDPAPSLRASLAESFLLKRLSVWQRRLQLGEWQIDLLLAHPDDLRRKTLGSIKWDSGKKTATIRVQHPDQYDTSFHAALADMEFTVVHELLHLEMASLPRSEASRSEEEVAINRIAATMLKLDRGF